MCQICLFPNKTSQETDEEESAFSDALLRDDKWVKPEGIYDPVRIPEGAPESLDHEVSVSLACSREMSEERLSRLASFEIAGVPFEMGFRVRGAQRNVFVTIQCLGECYFPVDLTVMIEGMCAWSRFARFVEGARVTLEPSLWELEKMPSQNLPAKVSVHFCCEPCQTRHYLDCVGLANITGTTCYLNSLIQCLFHLKLVRKAVLESEIDSGVMRALQVLFVRLMKAERPVDTKDLTKAFGWDWEDLVAQQDVQELLRILLDSLGDELLKLFRVEAAVKFVANGYDEEMSEVFFDVSLPVRNFSTVQDAVNDFFAPVNLRGDAQLVLPDGTKANAVKHISVQEYPAVLCLHLQRFDSVDGVAEKLTSDVSFDDEVDFAGEKYQLVSFVAHMGGITSGHYHAFCLVDGHWTIFDDENVRHCERHEVFQENFGGEGFSAYLLFYVKLGTVDVECPNVTKLFEEDRKRVDNIDVEVLSLRDFLTGKKLTCSRSLDSDGFVEALAAATQIPKSEIVVRYWNIDGSVGDIIDYPTPIEDSRVFVADSSGVPVFVGIWAPGHEIANQLFLVPYGSTFDDLAKIVCTKVGIAPQSVKFYHKVSEKKCGDELSCWHPVDTGMKVLCELPHDCQSEMFSPMKMPEHPSHLTLLANEIKVSTLPEYLSYVKSIRDVQFVASNEKCSCTLSLSKDLTYDQVVRCLAKHLDEDSHHVLLLLPEGSSGNGLRPISKDVYVSLRAIPKGTPIYYEITEEDVRFTNRFDVTVINSMGEPIDRFPVHLPRGASRVHDLRATIGKRCSTGAYLLYYVRDGLPITTLPTDDDELMLNTRIFAQLGTSIDNPDVEMLVPVIHCDPLFLSHQNGRLPYLLKTKKPTSFGDILQMFSNSDQSHMTILRNTAWKLTEVYHSDDTILSPTDLIAITHTHAHQAKTMKINRA